jgi:hypothetical protein
VLWPPCGYGEADRRIWLPVVVCGNNKWAAVAPAVAAGFVRQGGGGGGSLLLSPGGGALAWHCAGVFLGKSLDDGDVPGRRFPC